MTVVEVKFFARIREQLGVDNLSLPLAGDNVTLGAFRAELIASKGQVWAQVLLADNVVKAVNQEVVGDEHRLADGDEVAFFPPVTGG